MRELLAQESIVLEGVARTRDDAITEAGRLLVASGAVAESYLEAMHEREKSVSTLMGNGLAIPHGTHEAKSAIRRSAVSFVRYADAIDWNGKPADFVVGIAGAGDTICRCCRRLPVSSPTSPRSPSCGRRRPRKTSLTCLPAKTPESDTSRSEV